MKGRTSNKVRPCFLFYYFLNRPNIDVEKSRNAHPTRAPAPKMAKMLSLSGSFLITRNLIRMAIRDVYKRQALSVPDCVSASSPSETSNAFSFGDT